MIFVITAYWSLYIMTSCRQQLVLMLMCTHWPCEVLNLLTSGADRRGQASAHTAKWQRESGQSPASRRDELCPHTHCVCVCMRACLDVYNGRTKTLKQRPCLSLCYCCAQCYSNDSKEAVTVSYFLYKWKKLATVEYWCFFRLLPWKLFTRNVAKWGNITKTIVFVPQKTGKNPS